jgi:drug/metabolite transporter (DMT)-like permease
MLYLLIVSFVWAFSFGLIKGRLSDLDPVAVAVVRLALAALVFLPFFRPRRLPLQTGLWFAGVGAVQFGAMYVFYLWAFRYLQAYEVALFTIFTPFYVALLDAAIERRFVLRYFVAAALAVAGAGVMLGARGLDADSAAGFLLVQGSNLCFAAGQIAYKRSRHRAADTSDASLFGWLYLGALIATFALSAGATDWADFQPNSSQWLTLVYLGVLASGLCFFGWNLGALRVNAGTLAVFNNLKIPLAVACSLLFFGETANLPRLIGSLALLVVAVFMAERSPRARR